MDERPDLSRRVDPADESTTIYVAGPSDTPEDDIVTDAPAPSPTSAPESDEDQDIEELRDDIEETRAELSQTIDAIQERLAPQNLMEQAKDAARDATIGRAEQMVSDASDTAKDVSTSMIETIKQNPLPVAMVAFGVGWLWMHRQSAASTSNESGYRSQYGQMQRASGGISGTTSQVQQKAGQIASQVQDQAGQMVSQTQEQVGAWADQAQEQVTQWGGQTQDQLHQFKSQFDRLLQENPLTVAAVALSLGAAAGLAVPGTPQENQWLGETRDQLVDKAQAAAQDTMQKVQQVAGKAQDAAEQEAKQQGLTNQSD